MIVSKFCLWVDIQDLITFPTFCDNRLRGSDETRVEFPPLTCVVVLTTLALLCDCVIYTNRTLRISGSQVSGCGHIHVGAYGNLYWTAGQRIDPSRNTPFIWRVKSTDTNSETVSQMSYTNWYPRQPDFSGQAESCMHLWSGHSYTWNDMYCSNAWCSICELDI